MAIARVQTINAANSGTSLSLAFPSGVTAGNSIIASLGSGSGSLDTYTCADDQSGSYSEDQSLRPTGNGRPVYIWHASDVVGGTTTVTVTPLSSEDSRLTIIEVDQNLEVDVSANSTNHTSNSTVHPHGSITTTVANTYVVTSIAFAGNSGTCTPETNYTELYDHARKYTMERIPTAAISEDPVVDSVSNARSTCCIVAYKEASVRRKTSWGLYYQSPRPGRPFGYYFPK